MPNIGLIKDEPFYFIWCQMKRRCRVYPQYLEKGIEVCDAWQDFRTFQAWAIATYVDGCTLDRENTNKGYEPNNCRWVTKTVQSRNTSHRKNASSKYMGVSWFKANSKWGANIRVNKKLIFLGLHESELDAAIARDTYIVQNNLTNFTMNNVL